MQADDTLRIPAHVMARALGEEMVILDAAGSVYFGLNAVGARAWELFAKGLSFRQVCEALEAEFDVARERLEADIGTLADELVAAALAERQASRPSEK